MYSSEAIISCLSLSCFLILCQGKSEKARAFGREIESCVGGADGEQFDESGG